VNSSVESNTKQWQVLVAHVLGLVMKNLQSSLEVAIDSLGQRGLVVIRCGSEMGHPPSEAQVFEHSAAENSGIVSDNGARCAGKNAFSKQSQTT
jgi:hypothetical protein